MVPENQWLKLGEGIFQPHVILKDNGPVKTPLQKDFTLPRSQYIHSVNSSENECWNVQTRRKYLNVLKPTVLCYK